MDVLRPRKNAAALKGLVVNSDEQDRRRLVEILCECGLAPVFASTVAESGIALAEHDICVALCGDCLADGSYEDIVKLASCSDTEVPVIVVSRTGDWSRCLTAISAGAFDYLAYPPIAGELQRSIRSALSEYNCTSKAPESF